MAGEDDNAEHSETARLAKALKGVGKFELLLLLLFPLEFVLLTGLVKEGIERAGFLEKLVTDREREQAVDTAFMLLFLSGGVSERSSLVWLWLSFDLLGVVL